MFFAHPFPRPESVKVRMAAYEKSAVSLADDYRKRNLLVSVPADGTPEQICERAMGAPAEHA